MPHLHWPRLAPLIALAILVPAAHADFVEFYDRADWETEVGPFETIDFTGFPDNTLITDQYLDQGVDFTDGFNWIRLSESLFHDGAGLRGGSIIEIEFAQPIFAVGADFPGAIEFTLFSEGLPVYEGGIMGGGGSGFFGGIVGTTSFDRVQIVDPIDFVVSIDDLSFAVPAAPTWLVALGLLRGRRSRRD